MTYKKKLIEVALPLNAINRASAAGKMAGTRPHPQTLHRWWARRPLEAARAVLWASLVDDPSADPARFPSEQSQREERARLFRILEGIVQPESKDDLELWSAASQAIADSVEVLPTVLDPFCGGGTIPIEAQRLGLPTIGGDLNPVAVMISRAAVQIPSRFSGNGPINSGQMQHQLEASWDRAAGLAADVAHYGALMGEWAAESLGQIYTSADGSGFGEGDTVVAWIWARTVESPDPSWHGHVPLVRSWILSRKPGRPVVWVEPEIDRATRKISYRVREGGQPIEGTVSRAKGRCLATGSPIRGDYIKEMGKKGEMGVHLIAIVSESPRGRRYLTAQSTGERIVIDGWQPHGQVPERLTGGTCFGYGLTQWHQLFTDRQLTALNTFIDLLPRIKEQVVRDACQAGLEDDGRRLRDGGEGAEAYGDAVITYLGLTVSKCVEWWSTLCTWHAGNQQIRNVFARQSLAMTWDFVEANPLSGGMGSWASMLKWTVRAIGSLPAGQAGEIVQRDAQALLAGSKGALVSTDPPYFDNISYSDLSDFFYVWMRRALAETWPDVFSTMLTPKAEELIADARRHQSKARAFDHFQHGMQDVLSQVATAQHPEFPVTVFYAFKQAEESQVGRSSTGWESFLQGLIDSGLSITATWPIRTEMGKRAVAMGTSALASSIVLACRPRIESSPLATRSQFLAALRGELPQAIRVLQDQLIAPVDMAQSAIGPGMAVFTRYSKVIEADGSDMPVRQALVLINEVLQETLSAEETEFDGDTRWALTWFEQFGLDPGPFGDAETLSKAKNTSATGVIAAGIAAQRGGEVRLLDRAELDEDWDPVGDSRLTVWEVCQYLIRSLGVSESDAGDLLRRAGFGVGERARQLAYLLYQVADRKGWSEEAVAYNELVQAWPELTRLAAQSTDPVQGTFGG